MKLKLVLLYYYLIHFYEWQTNVGRGNFVRIIEDHSDLDAEFIWLV